mgnify:CR=1 FL=1
MKKILTTLSFMLIATSISVAQDQQLDLFFMNQQFTQSNTVIDGFNASAGYVEGTPFFNNRWEKGTIKTSAGNVINDVDMRYEAYSQLLMIRHRNDSTYIRPEVIQEFSFNVDGKTVKFKNGFYDERLRVNRTKYLQVLAEGEWSLYKDVQKVFAESNYDPVFMTGNRYDRFEERTRYIFVNDAGEWTALIPRRRPVERFFGDKSRQVRDFVSQNRLDYGNDEHLARIFEYVNGLIQ